MPGGWRWPTPSGRAERGYSSLAVTARRQPQSEERGAGTGRRVAVGMFCGVMLALPAVAGARSMTVRSFDGTKLHVNFFTAAGLRAGQRAPTVLMGPGWGSAGDTNPDDAALPSLGTVGVGTLRHAGFNVLTWDPRGFGASQGTVEVDSPRFEGRDVSALISWLARRHQALLDHRGDPRVGMAGGSYGGGIQLVAAALDQRIDAIVPDIAWNSLITSLDKDNTGKLGWASLLYVSGNTTGRLDPLVGESYRADVAGQPLTPAEWAFYASRGPGNLVGRIAVPTLLIQGTADNLFTLQEAVNSYELLRRHGTPVKMLWFCGGHGICMTKPGNTSLIASDTLAWLDRYLKRQTSVRTGPVFQWVDQRGAEHTGADYPLSSAGPLSASGRGTLTLSNAGGSGPAAPDPSAGSLGVAAAPLTPARAANAVNVTVRAPARRTLVVGAPRLTLTYRGLAGYGSPATTSVYAQLVDDATGKLLGNQITPIPVTLNGASHTLALPLEIVAATDRPGEHFTLQIAAATVAYQSQRATGAMSFSRIHVVLPAVDPSAKPPGHPRPNPAA
jgi:ABC-2 type transport system ATP-binding protein